MTKVIQGIYVTTKEHNKAVEEGYKFYVVGDWVMTDTIDPWSGMPNIDGNTHYFTDREEAQEYAQKQTWVFNSDIHGTVEEATHRETEEEVAERVRKEEIEEANKKKQKEITKAKEMGMTVEEYRGYKKIDTKKKRYQREIKKMEEEIARMQKEIARKKKFIDKN